MVVGIAPFSHQGVEVTVDFRCEQLLRDAEAAWDGYSICTGVVSERYFATLVGHYLVGLRTPSSTFRQFD